MAKRFGLFHDCQRLAPFLYSLTLKGIGNGHHCKTSIYIFAIHISHLNCFYFFTVMLFLLTLTCTSFLARICLTSIFKKSSEENDFQLSSSNSTEQDTEGDREMTH